MADVGHRTLRTIGEGGEGSPSNRGGEAAGMPKGVVDAPPGNIGYGAQDSDDGAETSFEHRSSLDATELQNKVEGDPRPVPASAANAQYNNVPTPGA